MSTVEFADKAQDLVEYLECAAEELAVERLAASPVDEQFMQVERARLDVLRALQEARAIMHTLERSDPDD
jgi:hypothetical protein